MGVSQLCCQRRFLLSTSFELYSTSIISMKIGSGDILDTPPCPTWLSAAGEGHKSPVAYVSHLAVWPHLCISDTQEHLKEHLTPRFKYYISYYVTVPYQKVKESIRLMETPWHPQSYGWINCVQPPCLQHTYTGGDTPAVILSEWLISEAPYTVVEKGVCWWI